MQVSSSKVLILQHLKTRGQVLSLNISNNLTNFPINMHHSKGSSISKVNHFKLTNAPVCYVLTAFATNVQNLEYFLIHTQKYGKEKNKLHRI
jgi:hypothetical protein